MTIEVERQVLRFNASAPEALVQSVYLVVTESKAAGNIYMTSIRTLSVGGTFISEVQSYKLEMKLPGTT